MSSEAVHLILPAFNEARTLLAVLEEIHDSLEGFRVVVIDDGSQDGTAEVAARGGARVLRHPFNLGYGAALQTGYKYAMERGASLLVQMDADGQHLPADVPALLEPVRAGECDLVVGSRFLEPTGYQMGAMRSLGRGVFRRVAGWAGLDITDPTSGFQAMNRRALELFAADWYPFDYPDVDVLLQAFRSGLQVRERPVRMKQSERTSSLHSGWKPIYYCYRMALSLWAVSAAPRGRRG